MPGYHEKEWNEYLEGFRRIQREIDELKKDIQQLAKDVEPPEPAFNEISGADHLRNICEQARRLK